MAFDVRGRDKTVTIDATDYALVKARGDGNCLLHAAGHGLWVAGLGHVGVDDHAAMRAEVVAYLDEHAAETNLLGFKLRDGMGIARNNQGAVTELHKAAIDHRIEFLRRDRSWAGEACMTAIERLYDVEIEVYDDNGGAEVFVGVPWYARSHAKLAKLRLCVRMVGHTPTHYDLYLPSVDYDAARDGGNRVVAPPRKGGLVKQSADDPWAYHLNPDGLHLLCPAIGHRQFAFSRGVVDAKGKKVSKDPRRIEVSLGGQPNVVELPAAAVRAVQIHNSDDEGSLSSVSWSDESDLDALVPVQEPLILPLARVEGLCTNLLDLADSSLSIETDRGDARQPAELLVRIYTRGYGGRAAKGGGLLAEVVLELAEIKHECKALSSPDRMRYTFALGDVLRKQEALLAWEASPFQLVASSDPTYEPTCSAWTHVHVPSEWDVQIAEALAKVSVIPMTDCPSKAVLGQAATVQALANSALAGELAKGREAFEMPADKQVALEQVVAAANLSAFDVNAHNYLVEVEEGEYYLSTSWASMASLELHKDGHYYLHALYWLGGRRRAYVIGAEDLANPDRRAQEAAPYEAAIDALWKIQLACANARGAAQTPDDKQRLSQLRAKSTYPWKIFRSDDDKADCEMIAHFEERYDIVQEHIATLRDNKDVCEVLRAQDIDPRTFSMTALDSKHPISPLHAAAGLMGEQASEAKATLMRIRNGLTQDGLELDHTLVDAISDFDTGSGKRMGSKTQWKRHLFKDPLRLTHVVTAGVSSCAGGVTLTEEKTPHHVWLWHLDAKLTIPMLTDMERLWPEGKGAPRMSTVGLVYPSPWELNKYRPDNLYPATVAEECESLFYFRGRHWYSDKVVTSAGCNLFGLDLQTRDQIDWVFTYDLDNRTELITNWHALTEDAEDTPEVLAHFVDGLYGTYRYDDEDPKTTKALVAYIGRMQGEVEEIKRHKRRTTSKSCRVPSMSAATIHTLAEAATPLLQSDCVFACEMGEAELSTDLDLSSRWTPGSFDVAEK